MANENRIEIWGSRFKEIRLALHMSQTGLGKEIGLSGQYIGAIEKKDIASITKEVFDIFVDKYKINPEYLQGYETSSEFMFERHAGEEDNTSEASISTDDVKEEVEDDMVEEQYEEIHQSYDKEPVKLMDIDDMNHAVNTLIAVFDNMKNHSVYVNNDTIKGIINNLNEMTDEQLEFVKTFIEFMKSQV